MRAFLGTVFIFAVSVEPAPLDAAATPTNSAIEHALQEMKLGEAQQNELRGVATNEAIRMASHPDRTPSPLVQAKVFDRRLESLDLGNEKVPLHIRFVEAQRRSLQLALETNQKLYSPCPGVAPDIGQWIDADVRKKAATYLECRRVRVDEFEKAATNLSSELDRLIRQLHLPAEIQDFWLKENKFEDLTKPAKVLAAMREQISALSELLKFMDSREGKMVLENGQIAFTDQEDADRAQVLLSRVQESAQVPK